MNNQIEIEDPVLVEENNNYVFTLKDNDSNIFFKSDNLYSIDTNHLNQFIKISNKHDLTVFENYYLEIFRIFLEKQTDWFENEFSRRGLENLFSKFLEPNINENCIGMRVIINDTLLKDLSSNSVVDKPIVGYPTFYLKNLELDLNENSMKCNIILDQFDIKHEEEISPEVPASVGEEEKELAPEVPASVGEEEKELAPEVPASVGEEEKELAPEVPASVGEEEKELAPEIPDSVGESELSLEEENINNDELEEVNLDINELSDVNINLNNEDFYIIYKFILSQINENYQNIIINILNQKKISIDNNMINDIVEDSDDESLDLSSDENNSDFSSDEE
uniref:Uncharacterized protein n=1 Tax=Florenciella sp. virus SA2 TaxID=3240092 RepID=A0AB39J9D3_9VIRU